VLESSILGIAYLGNGDRPSTWNRSEVLRGTINTAAF
jgi:hypothetical protein